MAAKLEPFTFKHLHTFDFLEVEADLLSRANIRFKLFQVMAQSSEVLSLILDGRCLAFGGQIADERAWVILSREGARRPKHVIKAIREELSRDTISIGTYVPEVPKYERFAKAFRLRKTNILGQDECGHKFAWWEF